MKRAGVILVMSRYQAFLFIGIDQPTRRLGSRQTQR